MAPGKARAIAKAFRKTKPLAHTDLRTGLPDGACIQLNTAASKLSSSARAEGTFPAWGWRDAAVPAPPPFGRTESVRMTVIDNVRVLVCTLNGRDALAPVGVFRKAGLPAELCTSFFELMIGLRAGARRRCQDKRWTIWRRGSHGSHRGRTFRLWF